jgi:hypothetical protein
MIFQFCILCFFTTFHRSIFDKLTIDDIVKFTKDNKMKYLVVEYTNGCFYGFNLVVKNERQIATNIVADVDNDFTITGWRMSKKLP